MATVISTTESSILPGTSKSKQSRPRKPQRPNYNEIHRSLLPVEVFPLPVLIPHNPLSLVAIALSYLTRLLTPPQRTIYKGYFSSTTSSIHVTDDAGIRALWEMGFFGRGNLSRSEPNWQMAQKGKGSTAEEHTGQRRIERRQQKLERAKKEQEDIAQQLSKEQEPLKELPATVLSHNQLKANDFNMHGIDGVLRAEETTHPLASDGEQWNRSVAANGIPTPPPSVASEGELDRPLKRLQRSKTVRFSPTTEAREFDLSSPVIAPIKSPGSVRNVEITEVALSSDAQTTPGNEENKEHLNLSMEEAFFLSYGLGVLDVFCEDSEITLDPSSLLPLFRRHSYQPSHSISATQQPDDPFMLSYVVYHHYRSLGWVVRSGVKFSVDLLLYNRGPAFSHAEFGIVILPAYTHPYWNETDERAKYVASKTSRSWDWLHGVNRVQAQVHKSLVLCYVEIPPPKTKSSETQELDVGYELSRYAIRDISIKRWTPNRSRD